MTAPSAHTRTGSMIEAIANVASGYVLALAVQRFLYPLFGIETTLAEDGLIATIFAATSLGRSYLVRRLIVRLETRRRNDRAAREASHHQRRPASGKVDGPGSGS